MQDARKTRAQLLEEVARRLQVLLGLLQVDDVDPRPAAVDEPLHLRVPPLRLVAEMDARLQQLPNQRHLHAICCHSFNWTALRG